jgi:DNA adenine methylase
MVASPLPWIGGKHYLARKIVSAFPDPSSYDTYVDLFGGAAKVLLARPVIRQHIEIFNDIDNDLVNFWMCCRDDVADLQARLDSLPYSREIYYQYYSSLYKEKTPLSRIERAVRWFYVRRASFSGHDDEKSANGWSASAIRNHAQAYHSAVALFEMLQRRFKHVSIDGRDFEEVLRIYNRPRTLFYCDPPYIGTEEYYQHCFTMADHERLAGLLNTSKAFIALSYYPHPQLRDWYPPERWRAVTWRAVKHAQRTKETHAEATELLLCNYPSPTRSLWEMEAGGDQD